MPNETYYEGLTLADQVAKFIDYHHDPRYRHVSAYEAGMLSRARERLLAPTRAAQRAAVTEDAHVFDLARQTYETVLYAADVALGVWTFPTWDMDDPEAALGEEGLTQVLEDPTDVQVQAMVGLLFASPADAQPDTLWTSGGPSPQDQFDALTERERLLANRVMYLPTIAVERSWPGMDSLAAHLANAKGNGASVLVFAGALAGGNGLVVAFLAGTSVIVLRSLGDVADGMRPGLRRLGRRLTDSSK
jgi:hypothetical protein